jgi:hypothetical protein
LVCADQDHPNKKGAALDAAPCGWNRKLAAPEAEDSEQPQPKQGNGRGFWDWDKDETPQGRVTCARQNECWRRSRTRIHEFNYLVVGRGSEKDWRRPREIHRQTAHASRAARSQSVAETPQPTAQRPVLDAACASRAVIGDPRVVSREEKVIRAWSGRGGKTVQERWRLTPVVGRPLPSVPSPKKVPLADVI